DPAPHIVGDRRHHRRPDRTPPPAAARLHPPSRPVRRPGPQRPSRPPPPLGAVCLRHTVGGRLCPVLPCRALGPAAAVPQGGPPRGVRPAKRVLQLRVA